MLRDAEFTRLKSAGKHLFGKISAVEKRGAVLKIKIFALADGALSVISYRYEDVRQRESGIDLRLEVVG